MRKWLVVLAALAIYASVAQGADETISGQRWVPSRNRGPAGAPLMATQQADTTAKDVGVTSTGGLRFSDESRDRDFTLGWTQLLTGASLTAGAADSSAITSTYNLRHMVLCIRLTPARGTANIDTVNTTRLVVQIRTHANGLSDSSSTFAVYQVGLSPLTGAQPDTVQYGQIYKGISALQNGPYSGEFVVAFHGNRVGVGSIMAATPLLYNYPNGIAIPLDNLFGRDLWLPNMSVRIRNATLGTATNYTVWLNGSPL